MCFLAGKVYFKNLHRTRNAFCCYFNSALNIFLCYHQNYFYDKDWAIMYLEEKRRKVYLNLYHLKSYYYYMYNIYCNNDTILRDYICGGHWVNDLLSLRNRLTKGIQPILMFKL